MQNIRGSELPEYNNIWRKLWFTSFGKDHVWWFLSSPEWNHQCWDGNCRCLSTNSSSSLHCKLCEPKLDRRTCAGMCCCSTSLFFYRLVSMPSNCFTSLYFTYCLQRQSNWVDFVPFIVFVQLQTLFQELVQLLSSGSLDILLCIFFYFFFLNLWLLLKQARKQEKIGIEIDT